MGKPRQLSRTGRWALALASATLVAAAALGLAARPGAAAPPGPSAQERAAIAAGYVCPMHPQIVSDHPDRCPICGMDLVRAANPGASHVHAVGAAALASLGVRVVAAQQRALGPVVRTFGTVVPNEAALYQVTTKFDGWLRKLSIHAVGERVRKGQALYEIYSPELVMKEREYFQFLTRRKQILQAVGDVSHQENEYVMDLLRESQKEREDFLRRDLDIDTVLQLEREGTTVEVVRILAQRSGVVTQLNAREGAFVSPASPVMVIAEEGAPWIDAVVGAQEAQQVRPGDHAVVSFGANRVLNAAVEFVSPVVDATRTHVRLVLASGAPAPQFGTLVDVDIRLAAREVTAVPAAALLRTGHGTFVMIAREDGSFVPTEVQAGIEDGELVQVGGLQPGAQIASNAQFLLDPSASLEDMRERQAPAMASSVP